MNVWSSELDGKYLIEVNRTGDGYSGTFTIKDMKTKEVLHTESVTISYGARFGPDVMDVADWEERGCSWADKQPVKDESK
jgi:hypothetical protein